MAASDYRGMKATLTEAGIRPVWFHNKLTINDKCHHLCAESRIVIANMKQANPECGHKRVMAEHTFTHRAAMIILDWLPDRTPTIFSAPK
jgi:hypothetical protein